MLAVLIADARTTCVCGHALGLHSEADERCRVVLDRSCDGRLSYCSCSRFTESRQLVLVGEGS